MFEYLLLLAAIMTAWWLITSAAVMLVNRLSDRSALNRMNRRRHPARRKLVRETRSV